MNRYDELIELKKELEDTPAELQNTMTSAILRAKKSKKKSMMIKAPLLSFTSFAMAFIILVNLFPAVAVAMSNTLGLKALISAVAINPSLKVAVEHDYYQEIGESMTKENVSVTVDYMILDAGNALLFFHVDAPVEKGLYHFELLDTNHEPLPVGSGFDTLYESGKLEVISISIPIGEYTLPEEFLFHIVVNQNIDFKENMEVAVPASEEAPAPIDNKESFTLGTNYDFTFTLHPDQAFTGIVNILPIHEWVTICDQRIYFDTLYMYPTNMRMSVLFDAGNTSIIKALNVSLIDEKGSRYDGNSTFYITDEPDRQDQLQYISFESSYFTDINFTALQINGIARIEKTKLLGEIDYANKTIENMPDNISIDLMELKHDTLYLTLKEDSDITATLGSVLDTSYFDTDGETYYFNSWSVSSDLQNGETNYYYYQIENFMEHEYLLRWSYIRRQDLEHVITIDIVK